MMAACDTVRPRQSNCGTEKRDDFLIRPLRIGNCEEEAVVVALVNRCYRSSENWTNESDILRGERITLFSLREESQQYDIFLIEHLPTSKIVACVKCGVTHKSVTGTLEKPAGYVGLFAVSPEFQSRGLGSWMLEFVEQHCRVQGMTVMVSFHGTK